MPLTYAGLEELATNPLVHTNGLGDLLHVGPSGLAQGADAVDAADSLRQECICRLQKNKFKIKKSDKKKNNLKTAVIAMMMSKETFEN